MVVHIELVQQAIGSTIRDLRNLRGLTGEEFGKRMGEMLGKEPLPRQTIYLMEAGKRAFPAAELQAISNVLDVRMSDLFGACDGTQESGAVDDARRSKLRRIISELEELA